MKPNRQKISFSKTVLDNLPAQEQRYFVYDSKVPGLAVLVAPTGAKSFYLYRWVKGKPERKRLGGYPEMTPDVARKQAQALNGVIAMGGDLNPETPERRQVRLRDAFEDYLGAKGALKDSTRQNYRDVLRLYLSDWQNRKLDDITQDDVLDRHRALIAANGGARANLAMRVLGAIFNFAADQYLDADRKPLYSHNPVKRLNRLEAWARVPRRQTVVRPAQLKAWWTGAQTLDPTGRDYLLLLLLTGLRREEGAGLRWEHIDLDERTLTVKDTKNHEDHTLPTGDYLTAMLARRKAYMGDASAFVFPGGNSRRSGGHISSPQYYYEKASVASGVQFTVHDLRRTFITTAESLDIPAYSLKRLLNHRTHNDVTQGYIVLDVERLRSPMQKIETFLLRAMGIEQTAPVVALKMTG